MQLRQVPPYRY